MNSEALVKDASRPPMRICASGATINWWIGSIALPVATSLPLSVAHRAFRTKSFGTCAAALRSRGSGRQAIHVPEPRSRSEHRHDDQKHRLRAEPHAELPPHEGADDDARHEFREYAKAKAHGASRPQVGRFGVNAIG